MNISIYSKDNILSNFKRMQESILKNFNEEYSTSDLAYGFNGLSYEDQDRLLKINKTKDEKLYTELLINEIRTEAEKCKKANIVGVKILIKNPEYIAFRKKQVVKKNKSTLVEDANRLLKHGLITMDEVISDFSYDEKQIIKMKYSEEPPLNSTAVSLRLCIDVDEVNEATVKFYKETIDKHKKKLVLKGGSVD